MLRRAALDGSSLLAFVRLRGAGLDALPSTGSWEEEIADGDGNVIQTTEDPLFANDPQPIRIDARARTIEFTRPGAIILRLPDRGKKEQR